MKTSQHIDLPHKAQYSKSHTKTRWYGVLICTSANSSSPRCRIIQLCPVATRALQIRMRVLEVDINPPHSIGEKHWWEKSSKRMNVLSTRIHCDDHTQTDKRPHELSLFIYSYQSGFEMVKLCVCMLTPSYNLHSRRWWWTNKLSSIVADRINHCSCSEQRRKKEA